MLPEELIAITETDLWKWWQKSLITNTDPLLISNSFPLQIQTSGSKRISSVIISAAKVSPEQGLAFPRDSVMSSGLLLHMVWFRPSL